MVVCTKKGAAIRKHCSMEEDIKADDSNIRSIVEKEIGRLGRNANLNHIDVSAVTDMSALFNNLDFNGDIYLWDVRNVIDMSGMFANSTFDGDISHWIVDKVKKHEHCFDNSPLANQPDKQPKFKP